MVNATAPTTLYVYRDAVGVVLYVGITMQGVNRAHQHAEASEWWPYAATASLQHFDDRESALKAETAAIIRYRPIFNRQKNVDWMTPRAVYLTRVKEVGARCVSDGDFMEFDTSGIGGHFKGALRNLALKAPHHLKVNGNSARAIDFEENLLVVYPKEREPAGTYWLHRAFDAGRSTTRWTVERVA